MASAPKRTGGVVTFVGERYGFIELINKSIPIQKVYFDFNSFGGKGGDLSKIFPTGSNVNFTFVSSTGDHKVKHKAINLVKSRNAQSESHIGNQKRQHHPQHHHRQPGPSHPHHHHRQPGPDQPQHHHRQPGPNQPQHHHRQPGPNHPQHQHRQRGPHQPQHRHDQRQFGRQRSHDRSADRNQGPAMALQNEGTAQHPHGQLDAFGQLNMTSYYPGAAYPHDEPYIPDPSTTTERSGVGQFLRQTLATGLTKLAEKLNEPPAAVSHQNPTDLTAPQQHSTNPIPQADPGPSCGQKPAGKKHGKRGKLARTVSQDGDADARQQEAAKAFNDLSLGSPLKKPQPCTEDNEASGIASSQFTGQAEPLVHQQQALSGKGQQTRKKDQIFKLPEAEIFKFLLGKDLGKALKDKLDDLGITSLNSLLLLRLNVGKQPTIRIYTNNETSNHSLDGVKTVELEDLQRLLRHKDVVKSSSSNHYGVKATLHSIRTIEQNGKLTGLTVFCQLHEDHDGLGLEIIERKGLTAVVSDVRNCPQKVIYNFLRSKSAEICKSKDVLVLDVDQQLTGCDEHPHPSLGEVTRISCTSSSELPGKIIDAIQHLHECVITIGVDSTETLQALQKLSSKGAEIIAEITNDMKAEVELMFT